MKMKKVIAVFIPIAIAFFASLFASTHPDALERISIDYGFASFAKETSSFFTDYSIPFIDNAFLSSFIAGLVGLGLIYLLYKALCTIIVRFAK
jgi:cobalt/nickel transport protein